MWVNTQLPNNPLHIFYKQLEFSSEPGVANGILENEPKSCLVLWLIFYVSVKTSCFQYEAGHAKELLNFWPKSQAEG